MVFRTVFGSPTKCQAVSGLRVSAKFGKLSCNILFQEGDIQREMLQKFQDITALEMRKKLGAIQTQYSKSASIQTEQGERTQTDTEKQKGNSKCTGKQRHVQQETRSEEYANQGLTAETF
ncbi:unnamed protein product [Bathycoccus prasinos]